MSETQSKPRSDSKIEASYLYAPVARFGYAVSASDKKGRFVLRKAATKIANSAAFELRSQFDDASDRAMKRLGWSVHRRDEVPELSKFEVNERLGSVIDFEELVIRKCSSVYLIRFCVTVCIDEANNSEKKEYSQYIHHPEKQDGSSPHSKIWVRVTCVQHEGKSAHQLTDRKLSEFFDVAKVISDSVKVSLFVPYKNLIGMVISDNTEAKPKISLRTVFFITSFTVSIDDNSFSDSYRTLALHRKNPVKYGVANKTRKGLVRLKKQFVLDGPNRMMPVDNSAFTRGIYWLQVQDDSAALFGLANCPLVTSDKYANSDNLAILRSSPSSISGIISGTMLGSVL